MWMSFHLGRSFVIAAFLAQDTFIYYMEGAFLFGQVPFLNQRPQQYSCVKPKGFPLSAKSTRRNMKFDQLNFIFVSFQKPFALLPASN